MTNETDKSLNERLSSLEEIQNLPEIPVMIKDLLQKLRDPDISFDVIEELVSQDLGVEAFLLRMASSVVFGNGSGEWIDSTPEALAQLGPANVCSLLTVYAAAFLFKAVNEQELHDQLWEHAVSVAVLAKILAKDMNGIDPALAFNAGLLHDIGKIILYMHDAETFKQNPHLQETQDDLAEKEFQLFGFSHIETGHFLLSRLGFDKEFKDVILFHHNPEYSPPGKQVTWVVALANQLSYLLDDPKNKNLYRFLLRLDLTKNQLQQTAIVGKKLIKQYLELF